MGSSRVFCYENPGSAPVIVNILGNPICERFVQIYLTLSTPGPLGVWEYKHIYNRFEYKNISDNVHVHVKT